MRPETIRRDYAFTSNDSTFMNVSQKSLLAEVDPIYIGKTRYVATEVWYGGEIHRTTTSISEVAANGGYYSDGEDMFVFPCTVIYRRADRRY